MQEDQEDDGMPPEFPPFLKEFLKQIFPGNKLSFTAIPLPPGIKLPLPPGPLPPGLKLPLPPGFSFPFQGPHNQQTVDPSHSGPCPTAKKLSGLIDALESGVFRGGTRGWDWRTSPIEDLASPDDPEFKNHRLWCGACDGPVSRDKVFNYFYCPACNMAMSEDTIEWIESDDTGD